MSLKHFFSSSRQRTSVRLRFLAGLVILSLAFAGIAAVVSSPLAERFPAAQPLRIVVPYAAGGTADILARDLAQRLGARLGQAVVVENRPGAGTAIGARYVAQAPRDGYTLFLGSVTSQAINPALRPAIGYDPVRDFTPLAAIGEVPFLLVTLPSRGVSSLGELVEHARRAETPLSYASAGVGSSNHLAGVLLSQLSGSEFLHVPYQGSAPALNGLMAGQVDFMFDLLTTSRAHVEAGRLAALATTGHRRAPGLPQVPTTSELGLGELDITAWFGLFAPADLPPEVRDTLETAIETVLSQPDTREKLAAYGLTAMEQRGEDFGRFVQRDHAQWAAVVAKASLKLEN